MSADDRKDNNSISHRDNVTAVLRLPVKHLIFAQLQICAPPFMSSFLFTFPAAQFTCCPVQSTCPPGRQVSLVGPAALLLFVLSAVERLCKRVVKRLLFTFPPPFSFLFKNICEVVQPRVPLKATFVPSVYVTSSR